MDKLLTVVVPAYNAENYIRNNLDSLCIREVERELEILVIDDGSTDKTGAIADGYANRFPDMVRVVHKENGGHGSGINCGIRMASGRWFKVVDADDWVEKAAFLHLLKELRTSRDDVVLSGFYWVFDDGSGRETEFPKKAEMREPFRGVVYGKSYCFDEIADRIYLKMHGLTWRTDLLRRMPEAIDENCYYVDAEYILYPIPYVKTICFTEDFVYQYRIGREGQSVSPEKMIRNKENYDWVIRSLLQFYERCKKGKMSISEQKLFYIEKGISRIAAGKIKILLSLPIGAEEKSDLIKFEEKMRRQYPGIYRANQNKAVWLLRVSRYLLYRPMAVFVHRWKRKF